MASKTIGPITTTIAGTKSIGGDTITSIGTLPVANIKAFSIRMEVTTALAATTPTLDVYIQRATQSDPGADDWDDFYHFPQLTTGTHDVVVHGPLPVPQDADGTLASASHAVIQEALAADTLLGGIIGDEIRVREVVGGTSITQQAIYNIHIIAD